MNEIELKKRRMEGSSLEFSVFTHHYCRKDQEEEPTEAKTYVDTGIYHWFKIFILTVQIS